MQWLTGLPAGSTIESGMTPPGSRTRSQATFSLPGFASNSCNAFGAQASRLQICVGFGVTGPMLCKSWPAQRYKYRSPRAQTTPCPGSARWRKDPSGLVVQTAQWHPDRTLQTSPHLDSPRSADKRLGECRRPGRLVGHASRIRIPRVSLKSSESGPSPGESGTSTAAERK